MQEIFDFFFQKICYYFVIRKRSPHHGRLKKEME